MIENAEALPATLRVAYACAFTPGAYQRPERLAQGVMPDRPWAYGS